MQILKIIIFFLTLIAPGCLILLNIKESGKSFLYNLALSYGIGAYFISMQIFLYLFIFRYKFNIPIFFTVLLIENIFLLYYFIKKNNLKFISFLPFKNKLLTGIKLNSYKIIIFLLIFISLFFAFYSALSRPTATYDSMAMWSYKAKVLYNEKSVDFNYGSPLFAGGGGHINYPWLVPITQFWLDINLGEYNDLLANLIFLFYFAGILIIIYSFLNNYIGKIKSLIFTFFASSMPLMFYHSYNAYADMVLSFYILLSFVYLYLWLEKENTKYLILSGLFLSFSFWVKNEAIIFILASFLILFFNLLFKKTKIKNIIFYASALIIPILPWLIFKAANNLSIKNIESGIGFHPEVIAPLFNSLFLSGNWNIWWYIAIVSFFLNFKYIIKSRELIYGWVFLAGSFLGFILLYLFTNEYQFAVNHTALSRNILTLTPVSVIIAAVSFKKD